MSNVPGEPLGERELTSRIIYVGKADLLAKLRDMADGIESGDYPANKPIWAADMFFNCCGGSPP